MVIAASVTESPSAPDSKDGLAKGFRATFWACFAALGIVAVVSLLGLKKAGNVGVKVDLT